MPELLDIPPELIEHIYVDLETLIDHDSLNGRPGNKTTTLHFRLTNRYIERCTRRKFGARHFDQWCIEAPDDASIAKFCAVAKVPHLSRCVDELIVCVDNDVEMRARQESTSPQAGVNPLRATDARDAVDTLAPAVYARNKDDVVDALSACSNINDLIFRPLPCDRDTEKSSNNGTLALPFQSGAQHVDYDMSSSFSYVLSLAEEAGLRPGCITLSLRPGLDGDSAQGSGLKDCEVLARAGDLLCELGDLSLRFYLGRDEVTFEEARGRGLRLGRQLQEGFANMPFLKGLDLTFEYGDAGIHLWSILAKAPAIPMLEDLELSCCTMNVHDFTSFVLKHVATLKLLDITWIGLMGGTVHDLSKYYAELSNAPRLEQFNQYALGFGKYENRGWIRLPYHLCLPLADEGVVDDYVAIDVWYWSMRWKGRSEVRSVLVELADYFWTL